MLLTDQIYWATGPCTNMCTNLKEQSTVSRILLFSDLGYCWTRAIPVSGCGPRLGTSRHQDSHWEVHRSSEMVEIQLFRSWICFETEQIALILRCALNFGVGSQAVLLSISFPILVGLVPLINAYFGYISQISLSLCIPMHVWTWMTQLWLGHGFKQPSLAITCRPL